MLQIATGRFFAEGPRQINELRGVLYTNLRMNGRDPIVTDAGRLLATDNLHDAKTAIYELTERIEDPPRVPGAVASHGIDPYLIDFAVIVSFAINVTCTPDPQLIRRLTSAQPSPVVSVAPRNLLPRMFDDQIWCTDLDAQHLVRFTNGLIGLKRKTYIMAIRAIRNYVTGLQRLEEDPELTYTLLVASIESLTHGFEGRQLTWEDYAEEKRRSIDEALTDADPDTKRRVRKAILAIEHVAVKRRFIEFVLSHLRPSFFREEASELDNPVGRVDLEAAIGQAYDIRSRPHTLASGVARSAYGGSSQWGNFGCG